MICEERARLKFELDDAYAIFDRATESLRDGIGSCAPDEIRDLRQRQASAWDNLRHAYAAYEAHLAMHECLWRPGHTAEKAD